MQGYEKTGKQREKMSDLISSVYKRVKENIGRVIVGKEEVVDLMLVTLFAGGHMLIEDVPGTGKTVLVKSLAASLSCDSKRIQFTPDLLPADITGINFFNMKKSEFEFSSGPVFTNILLADEINRATPKTQSGLLECMEEKQATVDGVTYRLPEPFMTIATQNPVENMGVFPLPEAQLDRFLVKAEVGYPSHSESVNILERFNNGDPLLKITPVASAEDVIKCINELSEVYVAKEILEYISTICEATRKYENVTLGVSTRGMMAFLRTSKGFAAISGRDYVIPDDVKRAAVPTLAHRLIMSGSARIKAGSDREVISDIVSHTPVPSEASLMRGK